VPEKAKSSEWCGQSHTAKCKRKYKRSRKSTGKKKKKMLQMPFSREGQSGARRDQAPEFTAHADSKKKKRPTLKKTTLKKSRKDQTLQNRWGGVEKTKTIQLSGGPPPTGEPRQISKRRGLATTVLAGGKTQDLRGYAGNLTKRETVEIGCLDHKKKRKVKLERPLFGLSNSLK